MQRRLGAIVVLVLLLSPLTLACAQLLHARMLVWGDQIWPGYALARPQCVEEPPMTAQAAMPGADEAADPAAEVEAPTESPAPGSPTEAGEEDDLLDDALGDMDEGGEKPAAGAAKNKAGGGEDDVLDDALDEIEEPAASENAENPGEKPPSGGAGDLLDDALDELGDDELSDEATASGDSAVDDASATTAADSPAGGEVEPQGAGGVSSSAVPTPPKMTDGLRTYCTIERRIAKASEVGVSWMSTLMVLLLLICAFIATARREHIALRNPRSALEDRVSNAAQLLGNVFIGHSTWHMRTFADAGPDHDRQIIWTAGMALLALISLYHLATPVQAKQGVKTGLGRAIACIPLYSWMAIISGIYFLLLAAKAHPAGIAIYLGKITEFSILYIQVGLYLWTGMLLRDTRLGELLFDVLRPLKLPTDLFAVLVVVLAAVPTAYSGASGILVLALGATIYTELRRSGASQQRALAATAMSGSLGVVLPPCLLVVIVASINLDVTTDELFHWGWRVFFLTTTIFALVSFFLRKASWRFSPSRDAASESGAALRGLAPYFGIALAVVAFFWLALNAVLDEHTAPYVLPVALLAIMPWDRFSARKANKVPAHKPETSLDTGTHIGALLMLMGLSACLGGVIESAEIVELFPHSVGSPLVAMTMLMIVLVMIGMVMDPYGAVILVSVTLYPIAKANGIHPLNFWMTALVSFELGYLTPPVALNHLLTRQVVQHLPEYDEDEQPPKGASFIERYERLVVPITVLAVTLLTVALGPILWGVRG